MNWRTIASGLLASALSLALAKTSSADAPRKCGPQPRPAAPLVMLDGVISAAPADSVLKDLDPQEVFIIDVLCMDPRDSTLNRSRGIPIVTVWTRDGARSAAERTLAAVAEVQNAHFRQHSGFVSSVPDSALPYRPSRLRLTLEVTTTGWVGRTSVDRNPFICLVYDGAIPPPRQGMVARQPRCFEGG